VKIISKAKFQKDILMKAHIELNLLGDYISENGFVNRVKMPL